MRILALPLLGVGLVITLAKGDEVAKKISCGNHEQKIEPPLFARMIHNEAHFMCANGYELIGRRFVECASSNWKHEMPQCREIPKTTIKMKCPFDHRNWLLDNLDKIASWIAVNEDNVLIVNRDFVENNTESQRLAAEMLARMNDPFYRFFGKMATDEKASLDREAVVERFKGSTEFRRLAKELRAEGVLLRDDDEEVLRQYYGTHYLEVLADLIAPYAASVAELAEAKLLQSPNPQPQILENPIRETEVETLSKATTPDEPASQQSLEELVRNDIAQDILIHYENAEHLEQDNFQQSLESAENSIKPAEEERSARKVRARGDTDRLLPTRRRDQDYFARDLVQVLDGTKAQVQEESLRTSYLNHLILVIQHILKHNIPHRDWPPFLQRFQIDDLRSFVNIDGDIAPPTPCPRPWDIGFVMIRNGNPYVDMAGHKLTIQCDEGFVLRGPSEMFCENGAWKTRENQMPVCEEQGRRPPIYECGPPPPGFRHGSLVPRGSKLYVQCDPLYVLTGSPELYCDRGRWMPSAGGMPACVIDDRVMMEQCRERPPLAPANGSITEVHMLTGGRVAAVRFMCNEGFGLQGPDYSKCDRGIWAPLAPFCEPNGNDDIPYNAEMPPMPNRCPALRISNGRVHYYAEGPSYARLTCTPGYRLYGQAKISCNEREGVWAEPKPSCIGGPNPIISCPRMYPPVNGDVTYVTPTAVRFHCKSGYQLEGREQTTCHQGRWRDVPPRCVPDMGGRSSGGCNLNEPVTQKNVIVFTYSDGRLFECATGYELNGRNVQYCRNGVWEPEPTCAALPGSTWLNSTESRVFPQPECPLPPMSDDVIVIARGMSVHYRCRQRDAQLVGSAGNICVDGRWSQPLAPRCLRRAPPPPPPIQPVLPPRVPPTRPPPAPLQRCQPGRIPGGDGYMFSEGRIIVYQCHADYYIRGATTLHCEASRWSQPLPECIPRDGNSWPMENGEIFYEGTKCHMPISQANVLVSFSERGNRVIYSCANAPTKMGYQTCSPYGDWQGPMPNCGSAPPTVSPGGGGQGVCEPQEIPNGRFYQYRDDIGFIQCNHNYVIENSPSGERNLQTYCVRNTGVWDFGPRPPRCVQESRLPDPRPEIELTQENLIENENGQFQVYECAPPQVTSNYTWFIQGQGRMITLGCKGQPKKRSVGQLTCSGAGTWHHNVDTSACSGQGGAPACSMDGRTLKNGNYFVYGEGHYVFQCDKDYYLEGNSMAVCPGYRPNYPKIIAELDDNFKMPTCVETLNDDRPGSWDNSDEDAEEAHFGGRQCHWPKQFADANSSEYLITKGGQEVTFVCSGAVKTVRCKESEWIGDDLACLERQHQQRGCDDRLPNEPQYGTYFRYQDSRSATPLFYFQCNTGYSLKGQAIVPCTDSGAPTEPICVRDPDPMASSLRKDRNPEPFAVVQCPVPPVYIDGGLVAVQDSGDKLIVKCLPGYFIEGTTMSSQTVTCNRQEERWSVPWPACVQRGERTVLRTPRYDPFGRELPQELTGDKAAIQNNLLRSQFLDHTRQMAEFRMRHSQRLRGQGAENAASASLPIVPGLSPRVRQQLEDTWGSLYDEGRQTLSSYLDGRRRVRRKNLPSTTGPEDQLIEIPESLKEFEKDIKTYKLTPEDIQMLELLDNDLRVKYIEDRQKGIVKSKDDPVQSQKFLSRVFGIKAENEPSVSNVIEQLKKHKEPLPLIKRIKATNGVSSTTEKPSESTTLSEPSTSTSPATETTTEAASTTTTESSMKVTTLEVVTTEKQTANEPETPEPEEHFAIENDEGNALDRVEQSLEETSNEINSIAESNQTEVSVEETSTQKSADVVNETEIVKNNKVKKGYDTSCAHMGNEAPQIENGFILSYELLEGRDTQMLRVTYRCDPDYRFKYEHTSSLLCRLGGWVGEPPQCIPDDDEE